MYSKIYVFRKGAAIPPPDARATAPVSRPVPACSRLARCARPQARGVRPRLTPRRDNKKARREMQHSI
jgi:hypothetical protein